MRRSTAEHSSHLLQCLSMAVMLLLPLWKKNGARPHRAAGAGPAPVRPENLDRSLQRLRSPRAPSDQEWPIL